MPAALRYVVQAQDVENVLASHQNLAESGAQAAGVSGSISSLSTYRPLMFLIDPEETGAGKLNKWQNRFGPRAVILYPADVHADSQDCNNSAYHSRREGLVMGDVGQPT